MNDHDRLLYLVLLALSAALLSASGSPGAEPGIAPRPATGSSPAGVGLEFRRVYAPADQLKEWPRDGIRYVPMKPEEFERLVDSARQSNTNIHLRPASISSAQYRATMDGSGMLRGEATLGILHRLDRQVILPLEPCGFAITQANWMGAEPQAAEMGLGSEGKQAILVKRSGDLHIEWSMRGRQESGGAWQFPLEVPACPSSSLLLDLPSNLQPVVAMGVVTAEASEDPHRGRWRIELGGHRRTVLRINGGGQSEPRRQLVLARQILAYDLSLHGLDLSVELRLDVHNEPIRELAVSLDPHLELVKAQYGELAIPWSVLSPASEGRGAKVVLQLPEPVQGAGRVIRLGAIAPLELERRWRLPALHAEGIFWQEGSATIGVRAPLNLEQLTPLRGRQSKTGTLSGPRPGQSAEIQYFAEEAGVEVVLAQARAQLQVQSGTSVELSGGGITGRVVAELTASDGELFQLEADVGRQWLIDSVEAEPTDMLHDSWNVKKEDDGSERLIVHLNKALSPTRPIRLIVSGRRLHASLEQPLDTEDLTLLRFSEALGSKRLMAVHAVEPYRLKLDGGERLKRIEPENLTEAERRLFRQAPGDLVFENGADAATLGISLITPKPSYSATMRVEATAFASQAASVKSHWLRESYWVRCVPDATRVDRVLVHFSTPRVAPPKWSLGTGAEGQFEARRLSAAEQASALMDTRGETWEVAFRQPRSAAFEIRASRLVEWTSGLQPVSLICVPEAASQQGSLVIRCLGATAIGIRNERLDPMPPEEVPSEQINTARARLRYTPMSDAVRADQPAVTLELDHPVLPAAWVWQCQLDSRYEVGGNGRHRVTYWLENCGKPQLDLRLPRTARLKDIGGIWLDRRPATWQSIGKPTDGQLAIDLPEERRFPVVCVQFQTSGEPLETGTMLEPPLPGVDIPMLSKQWTLWLPPGHAASRQDSLRTEGPSGESSWSERVFGPLGRPAGSPPFDPLARESWRTLAGTSLETQAMGASVSPFLERLSDLELKSRQDVASTGAGTAAKPLSWGMLLAGANQGSDRVLLVDGPALSRMPLDFRSPVVTVGSDAAKARGIALLDQAGLALVVFAKGLLLTSASDANSFHPNLIPLENGTVWQAARGLLADRFQQAAQTREDALFVPLDRWRRQSELPTVAWAGTSSEDQPLENLGWSVYRTNLSSAETVRYSVTCQDRAEAFRWSVFLGVFAVLWWLGKSRPAVAIAVLGLAAAGALVAPAPYCQVSSGAAVAGLISLVFSLIRSRKSSSAGSGAEGESHSATRDRSGIQAGAVVVLALSVATCVSLARADESTSKPQTARAVHNVLIPVDAQQKPNGENYFVPEALYQKLQRMTSEQTEPPQGWLLRGATYRGTLTRQASPKQLVMSELKAVFDLEVFNPLTRIRLPLGREGLNLLPDGATLDGRVIEPEWQEGDGTLVLDVRETGPYRLELSLRPSVQMFGSSYGIDLRIPRLSTSRLELNLPADAPAVEVPSAAGAVSTQQIPPKLTVELGASDRLSVRWPDIADSSRIGPAMDVEQLLWLKVHPGSVVLSARLKVKVVEGVVRQLRLAVDPRLRLLPFRDPDSPVSQVQVTAGEVQTIQFDMVRPISDQGVIEADFLLAGTSGVGNIRLPQIQVLDARVTRRWLAVLVDRALVYEPKPAERSEPLAVPVFEAAWGKAESSPTLAYNLASSQSTWSLATRPDEPHVTVDQVTTVSFAPGVARVQFSAQVETSGYGFQYHLSAPKQLRVESVVVEDSVQRAARWSRDSDGGITVFLSEPVSGRQQLTVSAKMSTPIRGPAVLPVLRVDGAEMRTSEIQVYREPAVLVDLRDVKGLTAVELPIVGDDKSHLGRLVRCLTVPDGSKSIGAMVELAPNQPEIVADQTTCLQVTGKEWEAQVHFDVKVSRGIVDEFRIQAPNRWSGPFRIDPPAAYRVLESPGQDYRELVVRPSLAVDRQSRFRISAPLSVQPGERVTVPSIRLLDADRGKVLVVLPKRVESRPVQWEMRGLKPAKPIPSLAAVAAESYEGYEAEGGTYQAVLDLADRTSRSANVLLANYHLVWHADGSYRGLARFVLEPAGLSGCPLSMPSQGRLISVRVDGMTVLPQSTRETVWQVPLGSRTVPQQLEVLFAGQLPNPISRGVLPLAAPKLGDLRVEQTLWSISGPADLATRLPVGVKALDELQVDMIRLDRIAAATDLTARLGLKSDAQERADQWQDLWCRRWDSCRQRIRQEMGADPMQRRGAVSTELESLDRRYKEIRSRLDRGSVPVSSPSERSVLEPPELEQAWIANSQAIVRCVGEPGSAVLTLGVESATVDPWIARLLGAAACIVVLSMTLVKRVRQSSLSFACRWPCAVGVCAGLAWWLWLEPSIVGWLIVLLTLVASVIPAWNRLRPGSPVVVVDLTRR